jgi:hypothetical protein
MLVGFNIPQEPTPAEPPSLDKQAEAIRWFEMGRDAEYSQIAFSERHLDAQANTIDGGQQGAKPQVSGNRRLKLQAALCYG